MSVLAVMAIVLVACSTSATPPPGTGEPTTTTSEPPVSTTVIVSTTTAPSATTSFVATTTAPTTTTRSPVVDEAEGSGCTPGPGALPDGEWFGYVVETAANSLEFDLACWFTGEAAVRASEEDDAESPPPNDYYVRNVNSAIRHLDVADQTSVVWFPDLGDPTSESTVSYADWLIGIEERGSMPGVWLIVDGGQVSRIHEQWVP